MNLNFDKNHYALLFDMFLNFQSSYYGKRRVDSMINKKDFKNKCPLIIFDCTNQDESTKYGQVDLRIEFETKKKYSKCHNSILFDNT